MQLIYMSTPSEGTSEDILLSVVSDAQINNIEHGISGFLISDNKNYIQLLEGSKKDVISLFEKIKSDIRHHDIQLQYQEVCESRAMPFLGMGLCFINSLKSLDYDFYFTRIQAQEFSGLIEGKVGHYFRRYII